MQKNKGGGKYFVAPLYYTSMTVLGKESFLRFLLILLGSIDVKFMRFFAALVGEKKIFIRQHIQYSIYNIQYTIFNTLWSSQELFNKNSYD